MFWVLGLREEKLKMSLTILSVDAQHQPRISTENPILSFHTSALTVGFRFQSIPRHEATTPGRWKLEEFRWQGPRQDTWCGFKSFGAATGFSE